jgi:hypothetical protein
MHTERRKAQSNFSMQRHMLFVKLVNNKIYVYRDLVFSSATYS